MSIIRNTAVKKVDDEFKYEIIESYGILSTKKNGTTKEFNLVSWDGKDPQYDIRPWHTDANGNKKAYRPVGTFTDEEMDNLFKALKLLAKR